MLLSEFSKTSIKALHTDDIISRPGSAQASCSASDTQLSPDGDTTREMSWRTQRLPCLMLQPAPVEVLLHRPALFRLPGRKATVTLSPLVRYIAAAVRSDPLEEPAGTGATGTGRPVVRLRTQPRTAGAARRSYMPSVTPERPVKRAGEGPGPSTPSSLPPCSRHISAT